MGTLEKEVSKVKIVKALSLASKECRLGAGAAGAGGGLADWAFMAELAGVGKPANFGMIMAGKTRGSRLSVNVAGKVAGAVRGAIGTDVRIEEL